MGERHVTGLKLGAQNWPAMLGYTCGGGSVEATASTKTSIILLQPSPQKLMQLWGGGGETTSVTTQQMIHHNKGLPLWGSVKGQGVLLDRELICPCYLLLAASRHC